MNIINKLIKISIFSLSLLTQAPITPHVHTAFTGIIEQATRDALAAELEASIVGNNKKEESSITILDLIKEKLGTTPANNRPTVFEELMRKLILGNQIADDYNRSQYMIHLRRYIATDDIAHNGFMRIWLEAEPTDELEVLSTSAFGTGSTAGATAGNASGASTTAAASSF